MDAVGGQLMRVRERIASACARAGRPVDSVRLVGVTKSVSAERARALVAAGCMDLAESRPQSLWSKHAALADIVPPVRWHLIGHLQRNKVRRTVPLCHLVHTLDSERLRDAISADAGGLGRPVDVLVEVNLTNAAARTGMAIEDVAAVMERWPADDVVRVRGLMGMAGPPEPGAPTGDARRHFARLRRLRDELAAARPDLRLDELSMGMSDDFEEAILEGATIVRIGSALWR